jgi:Fe-S-cluster-containing dehydrogenase component
MKAIVIDVKRCVGCYSCQIACKDEHCGNDWMPYAKPQPIMGQFWIKVNEYERGTAPKVKVTYLPVLCMHCKDAPCISSCPVDAISTRDDGIVWIDPKKCTGCQSCIDACPYGTISFNFELNLAQKCTGCAHLLDRGWTVTRCADNCGVGDIMFGEESTLDLSGSETLHPEFGLTTRVQYKNLPKKFIAGTVFDPADMEVVIGATCTLSGASSATATTDNFGDFWFNDLPVGNFSLTITAGGKTKQIDNISTEKDINIGDIALS